MAAAAKESGNSGIFWMNGVSDDERPLVFVPGLEGEGKSRFPSSLGSSSTNNITSSKSCTKTKKSGKKQGHTQSGHSGVYTKEQVSVHHNATAATQHTLSPALGGFLPSTQVISETSRTKSQVCLKDLCPEDKRRIANLIEELARVSEEKEESVQRLKDEQENFECKIQKLEQQNVVIIQERESLQQQYRECQELLGLYQQYLSQQQAKLNQSIAQLSQAPAHSKVLSSEEAPSRTSPSRASGSPTDGSYLGLAAARAQQPQVHRSGGGGRGTTTAFSSHASLSRASEFSPTHGPIKQHRVQKRECRHSESHHRCQDSGSRVENGHHDTLTQHECERLYSRNAIGLEANEALTRPLLGHEDWEEKRHHLLLQKMQLETERERLQARLAEQEERLNRQNRELHQSRLEYSRLAKLAQSDMSSSNARNGALQQESLSQQHAPSSVRDDAEVNPAGQCLHETPPQIVSAPLGNGKEALQRSKKDMATSPVKSPASLSKPTSVPVMPKTPEDRLDFSVVELLDVFSPISAPELSKRSTRRPKVSQQRLAAPKPVGRTLFTPGSYLQSTQQDLEESQILEDIFFIC